MRASKAWLLAVTTGAVLAAACLEHGDPYLSARDTEPPSLVNSFPPLQEADAGAAEPEHAPLDAGVILTFSEPMDEESLRGGLSLFKTATPDTPIPLFVAVEPPLDPNLRPQVQGDVEFLVEVWPESGAFEPNTRYTLELGTILSDTEGNALPEQRLLRFRTGAP